MMSGLMPDFFPHGHKTTAAGPAIMSAFDAEKKRKGWSQVQLPCY